MIKQVSVIGAGLMGSGIVQIAAQNGFKTVMIDTSQDALNKGKGMIMKSLERISKKTNNPNLVDSTMLNITTATTIDATKDSDLVIEAIVENLDVKHKLFKGLDTLVKENGIFASNTSSLNIREIAKVTKRMDRFVGLHFFNPVPQMKLVEIIKLNETKNQVFDSVLEFSKKVGKTAVTCKDTPGFLFV